MFAASLPVAGSGMGLAPPRQKEILAKFFTMDSTFQ